MARRGAVREERKGRKGREIVEDPRRTKSTLGAKTHRRLLRRNWPSSAKGAGRRRRRGNRARRARAINFGAAVRTRARASAARRWRKSLASPPPPPTTSEGLTLGAATLVTAGLARRSAKGVNRRRDRAYVK